MYYKCCVPGCNSRKDDILHKFPNCNKRREKWLRLINCDNLRLKSVRKLMHLQVCHKHFEKRFITQRSRILGTAFPTLFSESEILSGTPSTPLTDSEDTRSEHNDHSYARKRHYDHNYCKQGLQTSYSASNKELLEVVPAVRRSKGKLKACSTVECQQNISSELLPSTPKRTLVGHCSTADQQNISSEVVPPTVLDEFSVTEGQQKISSEKILSTKRRHCMTQDEQNVPSEELLSTPKRRYCIKEDQQNVPSEKNLSTPKRRHCITQDEQNVPSGSGTNQLKKKSKGRVIKSFKALTPRCKHLYKKYKYSQKSLGVIRRAKRASECENMCEKLSKLNPLAKKILTMQLRLCTLKKKYRRFTEDEKVFFLSLFKQGPKSYRYLRKVLILPSEATLKRFVGTLHVTSGINAQIFNAVKEEVDTWKEAKKYCSIIFDEMALETGLFYTPSDEISGFVETVEKKKRFADHALVFMIKGIVCNWKQPIAYYFCEGATSKNELKNIIRQVVTAVGETGLIPLALVSDQGTSFQAALKSLQEDTRRCQILENKNTDDSIHINGFNMYIVYDPPHLIKGLRNNFLTKDISFNNKIARWSDIVDVYQTDCRHTETRLLHKLNDEHVIPEKVKKMKVKNCVQVFSKTVAGALNFNSAFSHYADGKAVSETLKTTAEVVSFFDDLFDSVNGTVNFNPKRKGKELRTAVTKNSKHHKFWRDAKEKLKSLKFIDKNNCEISVPSIKNWITTLESYEKLWQTLQEKNIEKMKPRYINSDAIENYFGRIRAYNFRSNNPTCHNFVATFKSLFVTGFIRFHHSSFNCENETSENILKIKSLFKKNTTDIIKTQPSASDEKMDGEINETSIQVAGTYPVIQEARCERIRIQSRAYTAGWVIRKVVNSLKIHCKMCKKSLYTEKENEMHKWITTKEYINYNKKLTYPSEPIVRYFGEIFDHTNKFLNKNGHKKKLIETINTEIKMLFGDDELIQCQAHKERVLHALRSYTIKICVYNWCNTINKILKGRDVIRLEGKTLPEMQQNAYSKFKKKLKKPNK